MSRISSLLLFSSTILVGCFGSRLSHPFWVQHLEGIWKANTKEGTFIEQWKAENDSTFSGKGMVLSLSNDTSFTEELSINASGKNVWEYRIILPKAREFRTVVFSSSGVSNRKVTFSHPENDFPASIRYCSLSKNRMTVTLYPKNGNQGTKERLRFKRTAQ